MKSRMRAMIRNIITVVRVRTLRSPEKWGPRRASGHGPLRAFFIVSGPRVTKGNDMTREMTGAEMVIQALADQGVEHLFGYPGGAVLPIYDAIFANNQVRHVLVRHEQGAVHAAEGYARSTGKVGCVLVTSGPGATNAVTGLTDALCDSIPIVCITGQVP